MRISFLRTGGFAGLKLQANFEPGALAPEVEEEVRRLADQAGFFDLPDELTARSPGADRFGYQISIEDGDRSHAVRIAEAAAPPPLKALLDRLTKLAQQPGRPAPGRR